MKIPPVANVINHPNMRKQRAMVVVHGNKFHLRDRQEAGEIPATIEDWGGKYDEINNRGILA